MIIGLIGNKRVGKDTFANHLVEKYDFIKLAFADPIKEIASILFNLNLENIKNDSIDKEKKLEGFDISLREFYQKFGTDIMQNDIYKYFPSLENKIKKKNFWAVHLFKKIEQYQKQGYKNFVISDVRFLHEVNHICNHNGILVKINRNTNLNDTHISENSINDIPIDYIKYFIDNKSNFKDFIVNIDNCYKKILKNKVKYY